jgi:AI-2 transport protein TqsA
VSRPGGTVSFVPLVFWAWLIGPLGAVLAIPLTLLADVDPGRMGGRAARAGSGTPAGAAPA